MPPRWVLVAAAAIGIAGAVFELRRIRAPLPAPPAPARIASREECTNLAAKYQSLLADLGSCSTDDDCIAEPRGAEAWALDGCGRYRRRDASTRQLDALERTWMQSACPEGYVSTCRPVRAQCRMGRCGERAPEPLPRDWRRVTSTGNYFSMFVPPDFQSVELHPDDGNPGQLRGALGVLSYDYSEWAGTLEGGNGSPAGFADADQKTRAEDTTLANQKVRFVTWRGPKQIYASVVFATVPPVQNPALWAIDARTRLVMTLACATDCEATFDLVAHTLEFY